MKEKETITWTRFGTRPANEQDAKECGVELGEEVDFEEEVELPGKYEVCGRCRGKGSHTNPSIDSHGISQEEWFGPDWDDESREMYMSGGYDVACLECDGKRVVLEIDEEKIAPDLLAEYYKAREEKAAMDREDRAIRYMESGGYDY